MHFCPTTTAQPIPRVWENKKARGLCRFCNPCWSRLCASSRPSSSSSSFIHIGSSSTSGSSIARLTSMTSSQHCWWNWQSNSLWMALPSSQCIHKVTTKTATISKLTHSFYFSLSLPFTARRSTSKISRCM